MAWIEAWGTYARSGAQYDVAMVGSPTSALGIDLSKARSAGYGHGIQFTPTNADKTSIKIDLSLIGISTLNARWVGRNDTGYASPDGYIYAPGWTYLWFGELWYSTDGGKTYKDIKRGFQLAAHSTPMALAYNDDPRISNWKNANIKWSGTVNLPSDFTHLKFEVRGEDPAQRHQNIYTREQVISGGDPEPEPEPEPDHTTKWVNNGKDLAPPVLDFEFHGPKDFEPNYKYGGYTDTGLTRTHNYIKYIKPWAIRKSGRFKTLDRPSGFFRIRKSGSWVDKSRHLETDVGKENQGTSRIRKSGKWLGQNRVGED